MLLANTKWTKRYFDSFRLQAKDIRLNQSLLTTGSVTFATIAGTTRVNSPAFMSLAASALVTGCYGRFGGSTSTISAGHGFSAAQNGIHIVSQTADAASANALIQMDGVRGAVINMRALGDGRAFRLGLHTRDTISGVAINASYPRARLIGVTSATGVEDAGPVFAFNPLNGQLWFGKSIFSVNTKDKWRWSGTDENNISLGCHHVFDQGTAPTLALLTAAGTPGGASSPVASVGSGSTDKNGRIRVTIAGGTPAAGTYMKLTFNKPYNAAPKSVQLTPNSTAASKNFYIYSSAASAFVVGFTSAVTAGTNALVHYDISG